MADEFEDFVPTESDDWLVTKCVIEMLDDVRRRLRAGAEGPGATLTADECFNVLGCLKNPTMPNSRPRKSGTEALSKGFAIAGYYSRLVKGGMFPKDAIDNAMQRFDCKRSTVYTALKACGGRPSK
jgi:transketolase N-terminal domain/subunit